MTLTEAMRLLAGARPRASALAVVGVALAIALVAIGGIGAFASAILG